MKWIGMEMNKMSKSEIDKDGFRLVSSKKKRTIIIPRLAFQLPRPGDGVIDIEKSKLKIETAVEELRNSAYLEVVSKSVSTTVCSRPVVEIVCFGLGHIGECPISRYQLALLLLLRNLFNPKKVLVYDPVFYKAECSILQQFGLEIIKENTEGSYVISEEGVTIVYFPHCPQGLTNNFLWSNWGTQLKDCVLICNSISEIINKFPARITSKTVHYIYKIHPYTTEVELANTFRFTDIFNHTSVHSFPKERLEELDIAFWSKHRKPEYDCEEELIKDKLEILNI